MMTEIQYYPKFDFQKGVIPVSNQSDHSLRYKPTVMRAKSEVKLGEVNQVLTIETKRRGYANAVRLSQFKVNR